MTLDQSSNFRYRLIDKCIILSEIRYKKAIERKKSKYQCPYKVNEIFCNLLNEKRYRN